jgi:endonuclease/exonuclease/phosphatase family metal-dependent hydrolase
VIRPSPLPVIALGDFNSNDESEWDPNCPSPANVEGTLVGNNGGVCGDEFAYRALTTLGMRNVSTSDPLSCCLNSDILTAENGGPEDFDHHIDHILTRNIDRVRLLDSSVSGLAPVNGFWNSDHAGVYSKLRIRP